MFVGNRDQFIINSDLCRTLDEVTILYILAVKNNKKAEENVAELRKNLKPGQESRRYQTFLGVFIKV